jgi:hypothetical protein
LERREIDSLEVRLQDVLVFLGRRVAEHQQVVGIPDDARSGREEQAEDVPTQSYPNTKLSQHKTIPTQSKAKQRAPVGHM